MGPVLVWGGGGQTIYMETEIFFSIDLFLQSLGTRLSTFSMVGVKRIGWAYLKAGFAAEWSLAWIYLADRNQIYKTKRQRKKLILLCFIFVQRTINN